MIDGYCHCGLSKYRPVEDVLAVMKSAGIERAVLCQHLGEYDNAYLAGVVERHPATLAAVCLIDPTSASAVPDLESLHATGRFRGVRLLADWLRDYESLWGRAVELGLTLVIYAPQGMVAATPVITRFAAAHPAARVVVTHLENRSCGTGCWMGPNCCNWPNFRKCLCSFRACRSFANIRTQNCTGSFAR